MSSWLEKQAERLEWELQEVVSRACLQASWWGSNHDTCRRSDVCECACHLRKSEPPKAPV